MMAQGLRCVPGTSAQFPCHRRPYELAAPLRDVNAKPARSARQIELQAIEGSTMKKDVQETLERALAGFEKRQEAVRQRLREREKFETEWTRTRTAVVVPALEEVKALLSNAGWQCEVRTEKDQGVHFTIYRGSVHGERPYMSFQPQKPKDTIVIYVATKGAGSELGSFALNQITQDFVQSEAAKFFERLAVEHSTASAQ
jgi:hypothetical protein